MRKIVFIFLILTNLTVSSLHAQDIISLHNGDIIKAKVLEVTPEEIKYKKASNPKGPVYTIFIHDVLSVNYENGDKDMFGKTANQHPSESASLNVSYTGPQFIEPIASARNKELMDKYNTSKIYHKKKLPDEKKLKTTPWAIYNLGITPESIMADENVEIGFELNEEYYSCPGYEYGFGERYTFSNGSYTPNYKVVVKNNSQNIVYVDVVNSFRISPTGEAESFYNDLSVANSSNRGYNGGLNLGAITNALGIGGIVGTLAQGIGIGGNSGTSLTVTENQPPIISIPPGGKITMPAKIFVNTKKTKSVRNYEVIWCSAIELNSPVEQWRYHDYSDNHEYIEKAQKYIISYSTSPNFDTYTSLMVGLYTRGKLGVSYGTHIKDIVNYDGPLFVTPVVLTSVKVDIDKAKREGEKQRKRIEEKAGAISE